MITSPDQLRLLIDDDGDFSDAVLLDPALSLNGNTVTISDLSTAEIPLNSTRYITLVVFDIPLSAEITDFKARITENRQVKLSWRSQEEKDNDYFTIQRSADTHQWTDVAIKEAIGNSNATISYDILDRSPLLGLSYYRLKQTDFDGKHSFSSIINVNIDSQNEKAVRIFPNPTENQITIEGPEKEVSQLQLFNALGQNVTHQISILKHSALTLDLSNLRHGVYFLKTKSFYKKIYKR